MAEPANVMTNADSSSYVDYEDSYEGSDAEVVMNNPMIAKDVNMSVDAKSLEDFDSWFNARVEEYKGYFEADLPTEGWHECQIYYYSGCFP